ncbi:MAG: NADH-quinone oxidoreductase subunit NuoN, partial [Sphingomonadales bacterium]|nr:NADH-quinone oxidoreductase subunit NuoN [Sphingomonadales bacterium]
MSATLPDLTPALPEIFVACAAMALLMVGVFKKDNLLKVVTRLGVLSLAIAFVIMVAKMPGLDRVATTFGGMFIVDGFSVFMKSLVLIGSMAALLMSQQYLIDRKIDRFEFPVLIVLATLGMMMMISANDFMALYVGLELQSLSLYVLASFDRERQRSTEAGLKYFVLGALSSGMLLYGISLIYGFSGTTSFSVLSTGLANSENIGLVVGLVFVLAGLAFKVSAVPFHMWTPDVYEGAPTPITAFFAVAPKVAALALFIRVMNGPFGGLAEQWQQIVIMISIASMLLGAFAAIAQTNIKRMMAYSSIGHVGYALIGLAVANEAGVKSVLIYIAIYIVMNIGAFACIISMRRDGRSVENIYDLAGLSKTHPGMAAALSIFMFSMAG